MEKIKELVAACDNESYMLSGQMVELRAIQNGLRRLLEEVDDIVQKGWDKDSGLAYISINEIRDAIRLIDMGFGPLFKEMSNTVDRLYNDASKLFDVVHTNLENEKSR